MMSLKKELEIGKLCETEMVAKLDYFKKAISAQEKRVERYPDDQDLLDAMKGYRDALENALRSLRENKTALAKYRTHLDATGETYQSGLEVELAGRHADTDKAKGAGSKSKKKTRSRRSRCTLL